MNKTLDQQAGGETKRGRTGAEHQEQRRAKDEMHFRDSHRIVRQDFKETQDQHGGDQGTGRHLANAILFCHVQRELGRIADRAGGRGVTQGQFGSSDNDAWFDMHACFSS
jgi:hypothetical protein